MSKSEIDTKKKDMFLVKPEDLTIVSDKAHPLFDERINMPLEENSVLNVMRYGIKQPIIIARDGGKLLVVAGRQRTRWALEANKRLAKEGAELIRVPCVIQQGDESEKFGVMISENEVRQGDPVTVKAAKLVRFLALGRTEQDAAVAFGVTVATIKNWLALSECSAPVRKAVDAGTIPATAAVKLSKLDAKEQAEALGKLLESPGKATVSKAVKVAKGKETGEVSRSKLARALLDPENLSDEIQNQECAMIAIWFARWCMDLTDTEGASEFVPWLKDMLKEGGAK